MDPESTDLTMSVSEFVAVLNQTLDYAFPNIVVTGELANLRVSKGKWLYFDLKDEGASVKFFGTIYHLPGPLEDGMLIHVRGTPKLHNLYGFSVNVQSIRLAGEGTIRRAAELLQAQLRQEGLFDAARKRPLPYPPQRIGLITSGQSAAYADFVKILGARWGGLDIELIDVQVQGEIAPSMIVGALEQFNALAEPPEVIVLIRGGGSAEDLAAFSTETVTRAVAASRVPTIVAIGHEVDISLAELAADVRASTPSNAAELLVPDRTQMLGWLADAHKQLQQSLTRITTDIRSDITQSERELNQAWQQIMREHKQRLNLQKQLLAAYDPEAALQRGYAILRSNKQLVTSIKAVQINQALELHLHDGRITTRVEQVAPAKPKTGSI